MNLDKITTIKYNLFSGGTKYKNLSIHTKQFPWVIEFRIKGITEIDELIKVIEKNSELRIQQDSEHNTLKILK